MNLVLGLPIYTGSIRVQNSVTGMDVNTSLTGDTITPVGQNGARGHKTWTDTSRWPWKAWTLTWETADNGTVGDTVSVTLTGAYQLQAAGTVAEGNVTLTRNSLGNINTISGSPKSLPPKPASIRLSTPPDKPARRRAAPRPSPTHMTVPDVSQARTAPAARSPSAMTPAGSPQVAAPPASPRPARTTRSVN